MLHSTASKSQLVAGSALQQYWIVELASDRPNQQTAMWLDSCTHISNAVQMRLPH